MAVSEEESHDISNSTSESICDDNEEIIIKYTMYDRFYNKMLSLKEVSLYYYSLFLLSLLLFIVKYVILYCNIDTAITLYNNSTQITVNLSYIISLLCIAVLSYTIIDVFLYYVTGYLLNRDILILVLFYTNNVTSLVSSIIVIIMSILYMKINDLDYKLKSTHIIGLEQVLTTCCLSLLVILSKDIFVKKVRMGFNHSNYLIRIQKCLWEHQFIRTLEVVKKRIKALKSGRKKYWMFKDTNNTTRASERGTIRERHSSTAERNPAGTPVPSSTGSAPRTENPGSANDPSTLSRVDDTQPDRNNNLTQADNNEGTEANDNNEEFDDIAYFKPKTLNPALNDLSDIKQKMIIFKEFEKMMNLKIYHVDRGIPDIKHESTKKAEKICYWLSTEKKKFQIKHLKKYIDPEYIDHISSLLNLSESQSLSEKEVSSLIEKTKREKYAVKKSLEQMDKALLRVSHFITGTIFLFAIIALLAPTISANDVVKGVFGTFFGLGFIFQTSVKNAIDSVIFLFIIHPYDIGDRIRIEIDKEEMNMIVSELNVFSTVFYEWNGSKIYIPNHVLLQKAIVNVRRSGLMAENIVFQVGFDTLPEKIQHLKTEITKFIKKHPKDFSPYFMFNYHGIEDANKLHLKIYLQHASNWQNYEGYLQRKAKFIMFLKQAIIEQKIEYALPVQRLEIVK
ncbi:hypothetical protein NERG_02448 [Nematocida ausubeli]|uniref:Mechanosensitive ion channel MscS domain-containing protein n=1 Tax=Nematocida ausubeli (strain ATCC PRA-371 / ERTm2) TaxID=1913371 RepID=H8ZFS7_NEMA1|nr:hypothetical protein NERG_02448 [Nematocida ausubeli]